MSGQTIELYVNIPDKTPAFPTITEALQSVDAWACDSTPGCDKAFPAEEEDITPVVIHIGPGTYREKIVVTRPYVTFLGAGQDQTTIVYGHWGREILEDGIKRGTFRTATVRIDTHDFTARHLTFQNDSGYGCEVGQALALYVDGDRNFFESCTFLGSQDTIFTAPLPLKEVEPGGFRGPGETKPRVLGRHCYKNCHIRGDVDFIFGGAICWFEGCTIFSQLPGPEQKPDVDGATPPHGYITAASTPEGVPFGYVLKDCTLTSDCPKGSVYLGRPWREFAKTVYLHCEMGEHIHPVGWMDWGKPHGHFYYAEYQSYGPGASPETRADFSHQLTDEEAGAYTIENVLQGWVPFR